MNMKRKRIMLACLIAIFLCSIGTFIAVQITQAQAQAQAEPTTEEKQLVRALQQENLERQVRQIKYDEEMRIKNSLLTTMSETILNDVEKTVERVKEMQAEYEAEQEVIRAQEEAERLAAEAATEAAAEEEWEETPYYDNAVVSSSPRELRTMGVIYSGGWRYTWYSENVLPGGGLNIPGRWSDGDFVRDGDGYLCVASSDLAWGTVIETPWGTAKVYDCGCDSGTIDMYVSW